MMKPVSRREFLRKTVLGASLSAALTMMGSAANAQNKKRLPNIVYIMADDMGYADLGCYGSEAIATPNIDKLASEGMRFTDAYSGCTVCAPARSTLMTGLHMGHTPVRGNTGGIPLPEGTVTLPKILKQAGYATGGSGKWGLGDLDTEGVPEKQGFDLFYGYYHQIHAHYYYPEYLIRNGKKETLAGNQNEKQGKYTANLIHEETLKFIREHRDEPFFCYCPWTLPHGRYEVPESDPAWQFYKDKKWKDKPKKIAAMTVILDRHVGAVMDLLDELGLNDNTLVIFCSDNGADEHFPNALNSCGPFRGKKRSMYEGGIRVPMIARWPGYIEPGSESSLPCYFPDMLPTFAALAGETSLAPENIDGISLLPTLTGKGKQEEHDFMYWEWPSFSWKDQKYDDNGLMQGVRHGNWKLVRHQQDQPWELYDLSKDIGEKNNLADKHPDVVKTIADWVTTNRTEQVPQIEPEKPGEKRFR